MLTSSSALWMACSAAFCARLSPLACADRHQGRAALAHHRADVRKVQVDQAGDRDQLGDALDALAQHVVRREERLLDRGLLVDDLQQPVVRDDDQRVDALAEPLDALFGDPLAPGAFEA